MEQQPHRGLTIVQWMLLVAVLGIVLTIAASIWQGPSRPDVVDVETGVQDRNAGPQ